MSKSLPQQKQSLLPVVLLALSALLAGAGLGIYAPLIAIHALVLGAPPAIATAMIMAFPSILAVVLLLPVGITADKTGRRKEIIAIGLVLGIIFNALLGVAGSWIEMAVYRTISGIVFSFTSLYMAIGALISPPEKRGTILGILSGSMMLGMGVSQIFAGTIATALGGYQPVYFLAAVLTLIALIFLLPVKTPKVQLPAMKGSDIVEALKARGVHWTALAICVYLIGWNFVYPSLSIVLNEVYRAPPEIFSLGMGVASLMLGIGTYIWGPVVDKLGGKKNSYTRYTRISYSYIHNVSCFR